jgi:hypothetical protein
VGQPTQARRLKDESSIVTTGCAEFQKHFPLGLKHKSHAVQSIACLFLQILACTAYCGSSLSIFISCWFLEGLFRETCEAPPSTPGEHQGLGRALRPETCQLDHDTLQCSSFRVCEMQIELVDVSDLTFYRLSQCHCANHVVTRACRVASGSRRACSHSQA